MAALIEDYALLGNCETAALVARDGSLDWLCFPRFDSTACFAALLGSDEHGRWKIAPTAEVIAVERRYRDGTLILETVFETRDGRAMLIDFMPMKTSGHVVRMVVGLSGRVEFAVDLAIRFDYGSSVPWVERKDAHTLTAVAGPEMLVLRSPVALHPQDHHTASRFHVDEGERKVFTLAYQASFAPLLEQIDADQALESTAAYWREFSDRCPDVGPWTAQVKRSLITLKAMTYAPTGGIVAAVTTSLPEQLGGERNWDYRYCWLRDATMTLLAFMNLGYFEEAQAWRDWLLRSVAGNPEQIQIMYGVGGERRLQEYELPWLGGYENSLPVRVGNGAATQVQLDVYGEVADALIQALRGGMAQHPRSVAISKVVMPYLEKIWHLPDAGIWEIRSEPRHFTHSKVMAWVAFDRNATQIAQAAESDEDRALAVHYRKVADEIHADVCRHGFDAELGSFVQTYGSTEVDASLLQIVLTGFLAPEDPRVIGTVAQIERTLMQDGLLLRYDNERSVDGVAGREGTFLVCSFWLADAYVLLGRADDAARLFERLVGLCNDVGLLAEQYDPKGGRMLGNFPQAFSHIGIINTALNLHRAVCPALARTSGVLEEA
ncbi:MULTISPECIES: glycoside hydrolase family 15 protein [Pseudomonas syringae group]|uniref:glycoside hydrolase family 15 protein n=1 Tax=Pseudomonas syringae group TaxID=136849 RepID=UPI000BB606FF|nr:glycoside hydrolase family 15 protein [Pseudomonas syringae]MCK9691223.1 glycoside hydrolase family 15 protein [Pseudomonas syringae pv. syringae]MCK9697556.1 glycoside hydrolase family 15 protein [Pseudomonas syringae pv. syringae]MCK9727794.1 glycoside hydrolase family 15 protein [Pseudomonas syringae pv. syringae]MCK9748705.1 glycoside hydrolase family 15 protein [Pseudomonas syringae pv. syringae]MDU8602966.1 glycoside hydrolase family 15 protein [Pseudomonas syringae]